MRAIFWSTLTWPWGALTAQRPVDDSIKPLAGTFPRHTRIFYQNQLPCLTKSTPTPSFGNRFATTFASNIPNGSSQMANAPSVILTSHASWSCSIHSRERDPTSLSLIFIASSNRD